MRCCRQQKNRNGCRPWASEKLWSGGVKVGWRKQTKFKNTNHMETNKSFKNKKVVVVIMMAIKKGDNDIN